MSPRAGWRVRLRGKAAALKGDTLALWFCLRDPRTPFAAKLVGALVVAYALSPIDLIPDFIPVLGFLDDLVLVPAGIWLTLRLVPDGVMADARARARDWIAAGGSKPRSYGAACAVVALWGLALWVTWRWLDGMLG